MTKRQLNAIEILMAQALLQLVTYYPDYPPLRAFGGMSFEGKKDFLMLVEDGQALVADIKDCTPEQIQLLITKAAEVPEFTCRWDEIGNGLTRIWISLTEVVL